MSHMHSATHAPHAHTTHTQTHTNENTCFFMHVYIHVHLFFFGVLFLIPENIQHCTYRFSWQLFPSTHTSTHIHIHWYTHTHAPITTFIFTLVSSHACMRAHNPFSLTGMPRSWTSWTSWGDCSNCGGSGSTNRTRTCFGVCGNACNGSSVETTTCPGMLMLWLPG